MKVYGQASSPGLFSIEVAGMGVIELAHSLTAYEACHAVANALAQAKTEKAKPVAVEAVEAPKKSTLPPKDAHK